MKNKIKNSTKILTGFFALFLFFIIFMLFNNTKVFGEFQSEMEKNTKENITKDELYKYTQNQNYDMTDIEKKWGFLINDKIQPRSIIDDEKIKNSKKYYNGLEARNEIEIENNESRIKVDERTNELILYSTKKEKFEKINDKEDLKVKANRIFGNIKDKTGDFKDYELYSIEKFDELNKTILVVQIITKIVLFFSLKLYIRRYFF